MKKIFFTQFLNLMLILAVVVVFSSQNSEAKKKEDAPPSFGQVEVFSGGAGYVKFFDRSTGKVYIYDSNMRYVSGFELIELGKSGRKF